MRVIRLFSNNGRTFLLLRHLLVGLQWSILDDSTLARCRVRNTMAMMASHVSRTNPVAVAIARITAGVHVPFAVIAPAAARTSSVCRAVIAPAPIAALDVAMATLAEHAVFPVVNVLPQVTAPTECGSDEKESCGNDSASHDFTNSIQMLLCLAPRRLPGALTHSRQDCYRPEQSLESRYSVQPERISQTGIPLASISR